MTVSGVLLTWETGNPTSDRDSHGCLLAEAHIAMSLGGRVVPSCSSCLVGSNSKSVLPSPRFPISTRPFLLSLGHLTRDGKCAGTECHRRVSAVADQLSSCPVRSPSSLGRTPPAACSGPFRVATTFRGQFSSMTGRDGDGAQDTCSPQDE